MLITSTIMACGGGQLPESGTSDVELFTKKCTVCHSWPHPARHTPAEWDHYLALMEEHMKNKGIPFPPDEKQIIKNYLYRNAR
jgi:cytochrome c5